MHREGDRLRTFARRALLLGAGQLGLFGVLAGRLYYLQVVTADQYALLADENRINHRLLPPARGRIFDRHGVPLARNSPTYRVLVTREQTTNLRATLDALAHLIPVSDDQIDTVIAEAGQRRGFVPITVREDLTWTELSRVEVNAPNLPGVSLDAGLLRDYPVGPLMAHVLGYVGPVSESELTGDPLLELPEFRIGKNGIEKVYDKVLRGRAGISRFEVNALGREIKELYRYDGEPGRDLTLTIDLDLQRYVYERLSSEQSAAVVVLDVQTGDVLALASVPTFDPREFIDGLSRDRWRALTTNANTPLVNKAIGGQYPPGSTFKLLVALASLEAGATGPDYEVVCPGYIQLGDHQFHCWKRWGHGRLNLVGAIEQSCDVYFYDLARRLGVDAIAAMARRFGLGHALGIDLPGERPGLVPDRAWKLATRGVPWQLGETLITGIGQGYMEATPLQLAVMAARIANGRHAVVPRLVHGMGGADDANVALAAEPPAALGISDWSLRFVKQGMYQVVNGEHGTAREARLDGSDVALAGKTGTSQVRRITRAERATSVRKNDDKPWEERDHALFVAFAPFREPRYALAVVVEHGGSGAQTASPIARDVMAKALELDPLRARPPVTADRPPDPRPTGQPT
jgi:penicillin-binding protein 2